MILRAHAKSQLLDWSRNSDILQIVRKKKKKDYDLKTNRLLNFFISLLETCQIVKNCKILKAVFSIAIFKGLNMSARVLSRAGILGSDSGLRLAKYRA